MNRQKKALGILFLIFAIQTATRADDMSDQTEATIPSYLFKGSIVPNTSNQKIEGLQWRNKEPVVRAEQKVDEMVFIATLEGQFKHSNWTLVWNNKSIKLKNNGNFNLDVPITKTANTVELVAIGPSGEIEHEVVALLFSNWEVSKENVQEAPVKRFFSNVGLGATAIHLTQTKLSDYNSIGLTGRAALNYLLFPPRWDIGVNVYGTLVQLQKNQPITARFLGANVRIGYIVPQVSEPWRLGIYGGLYYTTMFVSPRIMGFGDMAGPQLYPSARRTFKNGDSINFYAKYSPVRNGFSVLNLSNREIAAGGAYVYPLQNGHSFSGTLDVANIALSINHLTMNSTSITVGAGYGF